MEKIISIKNEDLNEIKRTLAQSYILIEVKEVLTNVDLLKNNCNIKVNDVHIYKIMKINKPEKFIFDKIIRDVEDIAYKSENAEEFVKNMHDYYKENPNAMRFVTYEYTSPSTIIIKTQFAHLNQAK